MPDELEIELVPPDIEHVERVWRDLHCKSYYLSWGWVENWLVSLPADRIPQLVVVRNAGQAVAAAFLGRATAVRRGVIVSRQLHLNATGVRRFDELLIEYNGLVGMEIALADFVAALRAQLGGWDELILPGLREDAFHGVTDGPLGGNGRSGGDRVVVERRVPAYFVDLHAVRNGGFLELLSSQTRGQIRKSQRLAGTLTTEVAGTPSQAIDIYDELCALHAAQWQAKGLSGAFADPWFDRFHRRLITQRFASGEIQLVRVRTSDATLGCLYNLVWQGRVLQYQSGFRTFEDARMKPGFLCHTLAIEHCSARGLDVYDMLGGAMRYKKSLSTGVGWLTWSSVQRPRLRFMIEDHLVRLWRARDARAAPTNTEHADAEPNSS